MFDAPRKRVLQADTNPKLIPPGWGWRSQTTTVETMDMRKRGRWQYVYRDADGKEYAFRGVYREVVPHGRLVSAFEFEGIRAASSWRPRGSRSGAARRN
ncbi:MAG: SRPBCC domain-containing protein [Methanobacteriota archaeon]